MRVNFSSASLFTFSVLFCLGSSLPFLQQRDASNVQLRPRATYSIVAVDGGASGAVTAVGGSADVDSSPTESVIQTTPPTTTTIIKTEFQSLSPITIEGSKTTATVLLTITPSPSATTVTATGYSVVNVDPITVYISQPTTTTSSTFSTASHSWATTTQPSSPTSATKLPPASSIQTSTSSSETTSLSSSTGATNLSSVSPISEAIATTTSSNHFTTTLGLATGITTSSISSTTSTTTYDNGQWHPTYPAWSNSTATRTTLESPVPTASLRKRYQLFSPR